MTDRFGLDLEATLSHDGPLPRDVALAALDRAAQLMTSADFVDAARLYQRVIGFDDPSVTAAALLGLGEAWHRLDEDGRALATWEEATRLPDSPSTYPAWRNVAAARVRAVTGLVDRVARAIPKSVVRGLQVALGATLFLKEPVT